MKFQNTNNDYIETISAPFLWCLLFGIFYFLAKGVWGHAIISLILAMCTAGISWLIYPFFAKGIIRKKYLQNGWIEIQ